MKSLRNVVARCATGLAIAAVAAPSQADGLAYASGDAAVIEAGFRDHYPCPPTPCPPNPCLTQPGDIAYPSDGAQPTPAEASDPAAPVNQPLSSPSVAPLDQPLDLGQLSRPSGGAGFAMASAVAAAPAPGYIDYAPIGSRFRIRYDNAQGSNDPTRAEFLYPTPNAGFAGAKGPPVVNSADDNIDIQELSLYLELAMNDRFSFFIDAPIRWVGGIDLDGDGITGTESGFSDLRTGFRYGLADCCDRHVTFQFLVSTPTGDATQAVGTGNTSFDIGLLFDKKLSERTYFFGEIRDWFTLDAADGLAGSLDGNAAVIDLNANVLRYGAGLGIDLMSSNCCCNNRKLTGLVEVVGWTVLDGVSTDINGANTATDASGDTIINGKYGVRYTNGAKTLYVGYGHNWSSDRWYSDLFRLEWGYNF